MKLIQMILNLSVHPRTCGEHMRRSTATHLRIGSSPHVRGTFEAGLDVRADERFIPARAGNIRPERLGTAGPPVHPRTCGEHRRSAGCIRGALGSSPHVRGTSAEHSERTALVRFIPARAGNMWTKTVSIPIRSVHPRTCGEHARDRPLSGTRLGSSPHVRGTFIASSSGQGKLRFIPARAGNILPLLPQNH